MRGAILLDPRRAVDRCTLVVPVPTILHPLIDVASHIMKAERVWPKASDLQRLRRIVRCGASLAVGQIRSKLIAPPIFCLCTSACGVLPFSLARKPIFL